MNAFVYVYSTMPREWMAREMVTGIAAVAPSQDEALKLWETVWNQRAPFTVRNEAPPRAKRFDDPKPAGPAIEHDVIPYTSLAKRFHPDLCGKRKFDAHMIMSIINELRTESK